MFRLVFNWLATLFTSCALSLAAIERTRGIEGHQPSRLDLCRGLRDIALDLALLGQHGALHCLPGTVHPPASGAYDPGHTHRSGRPLGCRRSRCAEALARQGAVEIFRELVLGCIDADFCVQILILQNF